MALRCRLLAHRFRFTSDGDTLRWACERDGCDAGGAKRYDSARAAARFAAAFDVEDRRDLGRRAPLGLLPLRLWRAWRRRGRACAER
ncbi:MAG: hypothetical protein QOG15_3679 [Solirubrobacteraceae bacterium]|nr:hypothetical protein [Solirubrobacteraceae bacterium]